MPLFKAIATSQTASNTRWLLIGLTDLFNIKNKENLMIFLHTEKDLNVMFVKNCGVQNLIVE
jgi:hypothetical protein